MTRILTSHVGSLPRSQEVVDFIFARENGVPYDEPSFDETMTTAVHDTVRKQAESGIDIVSDGEKNPYRVKISVPSFRNLIGMTHLLVGSKLADMPAIYWSLDYWPVEADR